MNAIILTYEHPTHANRIYDSLLKLGLHPRIVRGPDHNVEGYAGMCSSLICNDVKKTTAWDLAFQDISIEDTWFIEDDVAFTSDAFSKLLEETRSIRADLISNEIRNHDDDPYWHWRNLPCYTHKRMYSFNPLCRCSASLILKILEYRNVHGHFSFHEIMFPSLAETLFDLRKLKSVSFDQFKWRDISVPHNADSYSFYHPIKDELDYFRLSKV